MANRKMNANPAIVNFVCGSMTVELRLPPRKSMVLSHGVEERVETRSCKLRYDCIRYCQWSKEMIVEEEEEFLGQHGGLGVFNIQFTLRDCQFWEHVRPGYARTRWIEC
jgi:hypothetical protein